MVSHNLSGCPAVTDSAVKMVLSFMLICSLFLFGEWKQHLTVIQSTISLELILCQRHKGFPTEASEEKGAAYNIIRISVFQPEQPVRLQVTEFSLAVEYKRHGVLKGVCGIDIPTNNLLHGLQSVRDLLKPLTQNVRLGLDTHKHRRSLNVLVIGGSGAAKTRSYVLPNILEANTNYVITDPKMEVLTATGGYLKSQGYDVRVLNLVNLEQSDGYNPFRYIRDEKDALRLVNNLIQATTPKNSHESDPFWTKAETALLQAIILMLFQEAPESEQNFSMVMRVLEYAEVPLRSHPAPSGWTHLLR